MPTGIDVPEVGAQDPELRNSPIADEGDEDYEVIRQENPGDAVCHFNGRVFQNGSYIRSGIQLLRCEYGLWINGGPADPDNP